MEYEYSTNIDRLTGAQNTKACFLFLQQLGYVQYELVDEKWFRLLRQPEDIPGSNILCFPDGKIPKTLI